MFRQRVHRLAVYTLFEDTSYFGEMALLREVRHTASVRALTSIDLLVMRGADFTALATSATHFGELLAGVIRQRQFGATSHSPPGLPNEDTERPTIQ